MIYSKLTSLSVKHLCDSNEIWDKAFRFIKNLPEQPETGIHPIIGEDMFCNVMRYNTVEPIDSKYESHRKFVDLQYTIDGEESIDWLLSSNLDCNGSYAEETDLQFYHPADSMSRVKMAPGFFAIFLPDDAHRPKIKSGNTGNVFKLVIKINKNLLGI